MNYQATITVNAIGIFLIFITWMNSHIIRERRTLDDNLFSVMLFASGLSCFMEAISFLLDGKIFPGAFFLVLFTNSYLYFASSGISALWCLYVDYTFYHDTERFRKVYAPLIAVCGICWAAVLGNVWGKYFFSIDQNNVYHREPLGYLLFMLPFVFSFISIITAYRARKVGDSMHIFPIWAFLAPFFVCMVIQTLVYGISLAWCGVAIGLSSLYMYMQNNLVYRDPLTGLYNRYYLKHVLGSPSWNRGKGHSGIMIDLDYFKNINDTYGHSKGDKALCDVAAILKTNVPEKSQVFRFAGDEFIILLETCKNEEVLDVREKIQDAIRDFNAEGLQPYELSLSMGYSTYFPAKNDADSFLIAMDKSMYKDKELHHGIIRRGAVSDTDV